MTERERKGLEKVFVGALDGLREVGKPILNGSGKFREYTGTGLKIVKSYAAAKKDKALYTSLKAEAKKISDQTGTKISAQDVYNWHFQDSFDKGLGNLFGEIYQESDKERAMRDFYTEQNRENPRTERAQRQSRSQRNIYKQGETFEVTPYRTD